MQKIWNKGQRIRANDKYLVYHFSIGTLLFVFVAVLLLSNIKQLKCTDWKNFNLLENDLTFSIYNFITIGIATGILIRKKAVNPKTNCFVCIDMKLSKLKFTILIERQKLLHFHILHNQYFLHFFEWHIEQFVLELFHI